MGISSSKPGCVCGLRHCLEGPASEFVSFRETAGKIRILIVALDYPYVPDAQLTCHRDAKTMYRIAGRCGVEDITVLTDRDGVGSANFPTKSVVRSYIKRVAKRCEPGDWFVWFWAGHGINVPDRNGDEKSGLDQAFVTPDAKGRLTMPAVFVDDDFAQCLDTCVPAGVRILCINDCCHSGTICDIDSYLYTHEIYQISASQDEEEAEDIGNGGVLTTALRRAVRTLSIEHGKQEFCMEEVFQLCRKYAEKLTDEQTLSFQWSGTPPQNMAWPLSLPWWEYVHNPMFRLNLGNSEEDDEDSDMGDDADDFPVQLQDHVPMRSLTSLKQQARDVSPHQQRVPQMAQAPPYNMLPSYQRQGLPTGQPAGYPLPGQPAGYPPPHGGGQLGYAMPAGGAVYPGVNMVPARR